MRVIGRSGTRTGTLAAPRVIPATRAAGAAAAGRQAAGQPVQADDGQEEEFTSNPARVKQAAACVHWAQVRAQRRAEQAAREAAAARWEQALSEAQAAAARARPTGGAGLYEDAGGHVWYVDGTGAALTHDIAVDNLQALLIRQAAEKAPQGWRTQEWCTLYDKWWARTAGWEDLHFRVITGGREPRTLPAGVDVHMATLLTVPYILRRAAPDAYTAVRGQFAGLWEYVLECLATQRGAAFRTFCGYIDLAHARGQLFFARELRARQAAQARQCTGGPGTAGAGHGAAAGRAGSGAGQAGGGVVYR